MKTIVEKRLEYLRCQLRAEQISYGELADLQELIPYIDKSDVELLEAAGVPEFIDGIDQIVESYMPKESDNENNYS